jgi:hypothetical protein
VVGVDLGMDENVTAAAKVVDGHGDYPSVSLGYIAMQVWVVSVLDFGLGLAAAVSDLNTSLARGR